jgi:hypothetical protein
VAPTYAPTPARRRRRKWPIVLLVVVLVLAGLFVAADRIALSLAENKAASALQSSQHLTTKPDVSVQGFPFLTQLAAGRFGEVIVTASDVAVGQNRDVDLRNVRVDLHDVTVSNNYSTVHAKTATAQATIGFTELSRLLRTPVHYGGDGRLVARPTVQLLGLTFHGTVSAVVHASSEQGLTFGDPKASVNGVNIPAAVTDAFVQVFRHSISLSGLPFGVRVTGAGVTSAGVVVALAGSNLTYQR